MAVDLTILLLNERETQLYLAISSGENQTCFEYVHGDDDNQVSD